MDARELRIGNFLSGVIEDDQGEEKRLAVVVRGVDADSTLIDGTCKYSLTSLYGKDYEYYHDIEPIPLTEEWLERFGFEEEKERLDDWVYWDIKIKGSLYLTIDEMNEVYSFSIAEKYEECLTWLPIDYVHQVQNLFYALTGQELKLKEQ